MTTRLKQKQVLLAISIALVAATLAAYEPIRHSGFVEYDDPAYVTENPNVTGGITLDSVIWAFTKSHASNWHPITWLSHMLDCEIYGFNPLGHHITNLLIHITNSLLLFLLLSKITGAVWPSAFVAAAFALHPIHVESVAWIAERKDMLSGLFWMLTILAYVHYAKQPNIRRYVLVLLLFVIGLMSKPMVVTLPFVLLLLDWWPLNRLIWQQKATVNPALEQQSISTTYQKASLWCLVAEKGPMFVLSAVSSVITFIAQKRGEAVVSLMVRPFHIRLINAIGCYFNYIMKMLYPKGLAVLYPLPEKMTIDSAVLAVMGVTVLLVLWRRGRPWLVVGLLWYLGTLVPVIGLVQVGLQIMADRYAYLPSIGVFIIIAWGASEILAKLPHPKPLAAATSAAALIAMVLLTRTQVGYWQGSLTLFGRAVAVTENNYVMLNNYGSYLCTQQGRCEEAIRYFREAIRICPAYLPASENICAALLAQKKLDEGIDCLTRELQERNDWTDMYQMYNNLGSAYEEKGNLDLAEINYKKALSLKSDFEPAGKNLAGVFVKQGRLNEAIACLNELLRQRRDSAEVHYRLAGVLGMQGNYDDAIKHFARVLKLNPKFPDAHYGMGTVLLGAGRPSEAITYLNEALRISPERTNVYRNLGTAYSQLGKYDLAIQNWNKMAGLDPNNADAFNDAAWLLAAVGNASIQDANKAIGFAQRACDLTGHKNPNFLDTLAAACAAAGKFDDAVTTAQQALDAARTSGQGELADKIQNRIKLYQAGQRYQQK